MWILLIFGWLGCATTSVESVENTPENIVKVFIENLGDIEKVKSLFPSDAVAKQILTCDGDNQISKDKHRIFKKLDDNAEQFKDIQSSLHEMKLLERKDFAKGLQHKNCTFNETVESRKYKVTAILESKAAGSYQKSRRIIMIKWQSKWFLISI